MVCSQNMINRQRDTIFAPNIKMLVDKYLKAFTQGSNVEVFTNKFSYKFLQSEIKLLKEVLI